jgi:hypothetical protein
VHLSARILNLEAVVMKEELTGADYLYSVKIGTLLGFITGWAIGVALIVYLGSEALNNWPGMPSIPIWNGIGWATYGFIVGGGGIFAHLGRKPKAEKRKGMLHVPVTPAA